jgi:toxin secretion/phage lysis holin
LKETYLLVAGVVSATIAYVSGKLGILIPLIGLLVLMMAIDYVSGMLAAKKEAVDHPDDPAYGWSNVVGFNGIMKKFGIICIIVVSMVLDYIVATLAIQMHLTPPITTLFSLLVVSWFLLNEMLSIIENAGRMGADVPNWLAKYIAVLKGKIDNEGNGGPQGHAEQ